MPIFRKAENGVPAASSTDSPGRDGLGPDDRIVVNEVLANSPAPQADSIELFNTTDDTIDISGWHLSDSGLDYTKFTFPAGTMLGAGEFIVLDENDFTTFALSGSEGDDVILIEADASGSLLGFVDSVEFDASAEGETFGRWPDGTGRLYPMASATLGASNMSAGNTVRNGPVVISEIHYNPDGADDNLEFIQIRNSAAVAQDLTNWRLRGEADFDFAGGTNIPVGGVLLILGFDPANQSLMDAFELAYPVAVGMPRVGPWANAAKLDDGGGTIKLQRADALFTPLAGGASFYPMLVEDTVHYDDESGWPLAADGSGASLQRISDLAFSDDPSNWRAQANPLEDALNYATWAADAFPAGTPAADRLEAADPDGDEISNFAEYALVLNPIVADSQQALDMSLDAGGELILTFKRRSGDPSISVSLTQSVDLLNWEPASVDLVSITPLEPSVQELQVKFTGLLPSANFPRLLFRLEVSQD